MRQDNWSERSEVVSFDRGQSFRAVFRGDVQTPDFNSLGAAAAFVDGLESGYRKPESVVAREHPAARLAHLQRRAAELAGSFDDMTAEEYYGETRAELADWPVCDEYETERDE